jgi:hypothetical protein
MKKWWDFKIKKAIVLWVKSPYLIEL